MAKVKNKTTRKQKTAAKILVENRGISTRKAMLKAGYKENTAKNPKNLIGSKGFSELMNELLPNEQLLNIHQELLNHKDWRAKAIGLEKAYKLKGLYLTAKEDNNPYSDLSDEEFDEILDEFLEKRERFKKYAGTSKKHQRINN